MSADNYLVSPATDRYGNQVPRAFDDNASDSGAESDTSTKAVEWKHLPDPVEPGEIDPVKVAKYFLEHPDKLKTPHPPIELFHADPQEYIKDFVFLERDKRMREDAYEFHCLHWAAATFDILEQCTEFASQKLVDVMNENAALERAYKGQGERRTKVLTDEVYIVQSIESTRTPDPDCDRPTGWNRGDHIFCLSHVTRFFPKMLAKNVRFKKHLGLPVPGEDYPVVCGSVRNEIATLKQRRSHEAATKAAAKATALADEVKQQQDRKKRATPAATVGGARRKSNGSASASKSNNAAVAAAAAAAPATPNKSKAVTVAAAGPSSAGSSSATASSATATPSANSGHKRTTSKRTVKENSSEEEWAESNSSPKKKSKARAKAKEVEIKKEPEIETPERGRRRARRGVTTGTVGEPILIPDSDEDEKGYESETDGESSDSDRTVTQEEYNQAAEAYGS